MKKLSKSLKFLTTIIISCTCLIPLKLSAQDKLQAELSELSADSASLDRAVRYLKNPVLKEKVNKLFEEVIAKKRKIDRYPVDFYFSRDDKNNYTPNAGVHLTIDQLADSVQGAVELAEILRINKVDFFKFLMLDSAGTNPTAFYSTSQDNHFVELDSFPVYRQKDFLKQIFLETVLSTEKRRSLEFIWGRSEGNDAYFSTKLTAYNGQFSVFPKYRTYIGLDTFRSKKNWFYDLAVIRKPKYLDTLTLVNREPILIANIPILTKEIIPEPVVTQPVDLKTVETIEVMQTSKVSELAEVVQAIEIKDTSSVIGTQPVKPEVIEVVTNVKPEIIPVKVNLIPVSSKSFSVSCYDKQIGEDKYLIKYEASLNSTAIYDSLKSVLNRAKYLKIEKNNLPMQSKLSTGGQEIVELTADNTLQNKINLILNVVESNPNCRHSVEWITGRSSGGSSYFATVITAFDGQLTVFKNYKKIADREAIKDKKSWYNRLSIYAPQ